MSTDHVNDSVREEFRKLSLDGKTSFLVEAIFSTAGSAINEIGSRLNGLVSLVTEPFDTAPEPAEETESETDATKKGPASARSRSGETKKGGSKTG